MRTTTVGESYFQADDLHELDERLLARAFAVVAMRDVHAGNRSRDVIGLRHDIDSRDYALATAIQIARWETERGYRATFFVLHTTRYWQDEATLRAALETIALGGHEIGIHTNALAAALRDGGEPDQILHDAIERLRGWGHAVQGVVGHGDHLCRDLKFANDEHFLECARPKHGDPRRKLAHLGRTVKLAPRPLAAFGLKYEAIKLGRTLYNTDSNGNWLVPFDETVAAFERSAGAGEAEGAAARAGQLHLVMHPDWWTEAFPD